MGTRFQLADSPRTLPLSEARTKDYASENVRQIKLECTLKRIGRGEANPIKNEPRECEDRRETSKCGSSEAR